VASGHHPPLVSPSPNWSEVGQLGSVLRRAVPPSAGSTADSATSSNTAASLAAAFSLVVLLLRQDDVVKVDDGFPSFLAPEHGLYKGREREIVPHYRHQSTPLKDPDRALGRGVIGRVL